MSTDDPHTALERALKHCQAGIRASELHGSLCGWLCAGGPVDADHWLDSLEVTPGRDDASHDPALRDAHAQAVAQFRRRAQRIEPLLPPSGGALSQRAQAVVEWCRGFLGGFGLAGLAAGPRLPAQAEEILGDLGNIAATALQVDAGDERALDQVLDFVAMSVAHLHALMQDARALH